jgi:hypothetical protein
MSIRIENQLELQAEAQRRRSSFLQPFAAKLAVSFSLFVLLLLAGESVSYLKLRYRPTRMVTENVKAQIFKGATWMPDYFAEFNASNFVSYHAYTIWRRAPFSGKTINIDADGVRQTYYSHCEPGRPGIWMFGNSAMWGAANPDWTTIPSLVAKEFEDHGTPVCVKNFGEKAWVSTQEVIALMLELKRADAPPKAVVFYDGAADTFLPYESNERDVHDNVDKARAKFEDASASRPGFQYLRKTNTYVFLNQLAAHSGATDDPLASRRHVSPQQAESMAEITVTNYLKNLDLVDLLGSRYGFQGFYFWQPSVRFPGKSLSTDEDRLRQQEEAMWPGSELVFRTTHELIAHTEHRGLVDFSTVLEGHPETLFLETNHLGPEGNALVAHRMFEVIDARSTIASPARGNHR